MILKNDITPGYYHQETGNIQPIHILGKLEQEFRDVTQDACFRYKIGSLQWYFGNLLSIDLAQVKRDLVFSIINFVY